MIAFTAGCERVVIRGRSRFLNVLFPVSRARCVWTCPPARAHVGRLAGGQRHLPQDVCTRLPRPSSLPWPATPCRGVWLTLPEAGTEGRAGFARLPIVYTIGSMPNYVRWRENGARYFFTVVTYRRRRLFEDSLARQFLRQAFVEERRRRPFDMFACVLLPDHLHCLWTLPIDDDAFPLRWANIKKHFTRLYLAAGGRSLPVTANRLRHRECGIWQPRYWEHRIRDEDDWFLHRDYIHLNPIKHGYVTHPQDWRWSSIHRHVATGWLDPKWGGHHAIEMPDLGGE